MNEDILGKMDSWSRREEISADATERAMVSSNDERICLKERIMIKAGAW